MSTQIKKTNVTADDIQKKTDLFESQCRQTFSTNAGRSVLKKLKSMYCDRNLFGQDERSTCYMIGQRDIILELSSYVPDNNPTELDD